MASWWEITIHTTEEAAEAVADLLLREGARGVATEDPDEIRALVHAPDSLIYSDAEFLGSLPEYVRVRAYFSASDEQLLREQITAQLELMRAFLDVGEGLVACQAVHEADWANAWKVHYHPLKITDKLTICPSWEEYRAGPEEMVISLDPGSAFGTGEHATTALCLKLLSEMNLAGRSFLDLGCGSGILAIAAAKFGVASCEAIDIDSDAVQVAFDNAAQNDCASLIDCHAGELKDARLERYDVIAANILAEIHLLLAEDYAKKLAPGGHLILGGIIRHKADEVKAALEKSGLLSEDEQNSDDWIVLKYKKALPLG